MRGVLHLQEPVVRCKRQSLDQLNDFGGYALCNDAKGVGVNTDLTI